MRVAVRPCDNEVRPRYKALGPGLADSSGPALAAAFKTRSMNRLVCLPFRALIFPCLGKKNFPRFFDMSSKVEIE